MNFTLTERDLNTVVNALRTAAIAYREIAVKVKHNGLHIQFERQAQDAENLANALE